MIQILETTTTVAKLEDAEGIATSLLEQRLAACVQINGPITSIYRWNNTIERSTEWKLTIKSAARLQEEIREHLIATHPYEVPELLFVLIDASSESYAKWLESGLIR